MFKQSPVMTFHKTAFCYGFLLILMVIGGCGKKDQSNNDHKEPVQLEITEAKIEDQKAIVRFQLTGDAQTTQLKCRYRIDNGAFSEWSQCPTGQFELALGQVKEVLGVEVQYGDDPSTARSVNFQLDRGADKGGNSDDNAREELPAPKPAPASAPAPAASKPETVYYAPQQSNVALFGDPTRQGAIPFADGSRSFNVPQGMMVLRYAAPTINGVEYYQAYNETQDPWIDAIVPRRSPCEGQPSFFGGESISLASYMQGPVHQYCRSRIDRASELKLWNNFETSIDQVEVITDPVANQYMSNREYISVNAFTNFQGPGDANTTRRLFTRLCGVPEGYQAVEIFYGSDMQRADWGPMTQHPRSQGFIAGGTIYGLPVLSRYFQGNDPRRAAFHWCLVRKQVNRSVLQMYVGTWELNIMNVNAIGQSQGSLEFHYITNSYGQTPIEFADQAAQRSLQVLGFFKY